MSFLIQGSGSDTVHLYSYWRNRTSAFARDTGLTTTQMIGQALRAALDDCGLKKGDIDGLFVNAGGDFDKMAEQHRRPTPPRPGKHRTAPRHAICGPCSWRASMKLCR